MGTILGNALFHFSTATRATWFDADLFDVSNVAGAIFCAIFEAQFLDGGDEARQFWQRDTGLARLFDVVQIGSTAVANIRR